MTASGNLAPVGRDHPQVELSELGGIAAGALQQHNRRLIGLTVS